jgi:hypothetical protein
VATCLFYNSSAESIAEVINLGTDILKLMATNASHSATAVNKADVAELTIANGYSGPLTVTVTSSSTTGTTYQLVLANPATWTLTASTAVRGLVLFSDTALNKPLIARWNLAADGSSVTLVPPTTNTLGIQFASPMLSIAQV